MLSNIEETVLKKQLHELITELNSRDKRIEYLVNQNSELQEAQARLM